MRKTQFVNGEYYHIYNRGVDKREVFLDSSDYFRFIKSLREFNNSLTREERMRLESKRSKKSELSSGKIVEIVCFCLNPNHYHFILKQLVDKGIENFMHKLSTGYTNYFNKKNDRNGSLFQGPFKSVHIGSNNYLLYLSAYVNCNSEVHGISPAENYKWCSFRDYISKKSSGLCSKDIILSQFSSLNEYREFAKNNAKEMKYKKETEKLLLEG